MSRRRSAPPPRDNSASVVLCGAMEPPEGRDRVPVIGCAFVRTHGSPSIRVQNEANRILRDATDARQNAFVEGDPNDENAIADGWVPLWEVEVYVLANGRDDITVDVQYRRLPGCDNASAQTMMRLYNELGRALVRRGARRVQ